MFLRLYRLRKTLRLVWLLFQRPDVKRWQKGILLLPFLYIFSPLNMLTNWVPLIGWLDDVVIFGIALKAFESVVDPSIVQDVRQKNDLTE